MRLLQATLALAACLMASGCGTKSDDRPKCYPVKGKLFVAGQPAADAQVVLHAVAAERQALVRPHATVGPDGSYHLTTFVTRDGAPVGEYALVVVWPSAPGKGQANDEQGPDRLGQCYADPKNPAARVRVGEEPTELAAIDLQLAEAKPRTVTRPKANSEL